MPPTNWNENISLLTRLTFAFLMVAWLRGTTRKYRGIQINVQMISSWLWGSGTLNTAIVILATRCGCSTYFTILLRVYGRGGRAPRRRDALQSQQETLPYLRSPPGGEYAKHLRFLYFGIFCSRMAKMAATPAPRLCPTMTSLYSYRSKLFMIQFMII